MFHHTETARGSIHPSQRTPIIAHPLFLAGYIEHLDTGTRDMIADCQEYGLRLPNGQAAKSIGVRDEIPHTAQKILEMVGVKYQTRTPQQFVTQ